MIVLYSGTPGSGKSLDLARLIMLKCRFGQNFIGNMVINREKLQGMKGKYIFVDTYSLNPADLVAYAEKYHERGKEGQTILIIDECQRIFNSREWNREGMKEWNEFFQVHRHFGFDVYLISQYDRFIDRQIRVLIEYNRIHRKVSNIGIMGQVFNALSGGKLFVVAEQYYPMKIDTGSYYFKYKKKYEEFYDSYALFDRKNLCLNELRALLSPGAGDTGAQAKAEAVAVAE